MASILFLAPQVNVPKKGFSTAPAHGARVEDKNPTIGSYPNPAHVFLIYISMIKVSEDDFQWIARHMCAPIGSSYQDTAETLFNLAKKDDKKTPFRVGDNFINLVWDKPCYFYVVLDLKKANFIESNEEQYDPIHFHAEKPLPTNGPPVYRYYDANHSFYNGVIDKIGGRSALRCINYFKDENGNDLKHPRTRIYGFEIRFLFPFLGGEAQPIFIDPDGQNQGPPSRTSKLRVNLGQRRH